MRARRHRSSLSPPHSIRISNFGNVLSNRVNYDTVIKTDCLKLVKTTTDSEKWPAFATVLENFIASKIFIITYHSFFVKIYRSFFEL